MRRRAGNWAATILLSCTVCLRHQRHATLGHIRTPPTTNGRFSHPLKAKAMKLHSLLPARPEPEALLPHSTRPATTMASPRLRFASTPAVTTAGQTAIPECPTDLKLSGGKPRLLTFEELPQWYQDNELIRNGYRPVSGSAAASFASWRYVHNETVNIFSHLIPCVAFVLAEWYMTQCM